MNGPTRSWVSPMRARSAHEQHRVSTPLELFFDLCFVVAVAQAAAPLHHAVAEHHFEHVGSFLMVFFASAAATGAGLAVAVDHAAGQTRISGPAAGPVVVLAVLLAALVAVNGTIGRRVPDPVG